MKRPAPPAQPLRRVRAWGGMLLVWGAATGIAHLLNHHVSVTVLAMVYLAAVMLVAYVTNRWLSIACAFLSVAALNILFVQPRGAFRVDSTEHAITLVALLFVSLLATNLSSRLRASTRRAVSRERRARTLQHLAASMALLEDEAPMVDAAVKALEADFGQGILALMSREGDLVMHGAMQAPAAPAERRDDAIAHCVKSGHAMGPGTGRWDALATWYLPLRAGESRIGAIAIAAPPQTALLPGAEERREHAQAIADLTAGALLRTRHAAEAARARDQAQSQQLRSTLLASVSHDLRTPLAAILAAATSMQRQADRLDAESQQRLLALIESEARHLTAVTDNTLHWLRVSGDHPVLKMDWEALEEIAGTCIARLRARHPHRHVTATLPADLPLIRVDAVLFAQLITNLLDNALKYSADDVELTAYADDETITIDILDRGRGIPPGDEIRIFETFYRGAVPPAQRGAGLGLAISQAVASAHNARLSVGPREGGGSRFSIFMPLVPSPPTPADEGM
ncbi:ATP-binding protein [Schauerella aestuarii]|uniref:ATP-binding protein n=1 Tax=Schauerella aestuarii TaxID=2511204 RepID=UPI001368E30D|nr:ATP-binding protein [Achromobacter aestuarii]MYZ45538.1 DUF4118 domain-containing protein [Achromobacter aestuarii]